jgi:pilus assembly protein CpaE
MREQDHKKIVIISTDTAFLQEAHRAFSVLNIVDLHIIAKNVRDTRHELQGLECDCLVIDANISDLTELEALQYSVRRFEGRAPVIAVSTDFDAAGARMLVQMHVFDFMIKPVSTTDLVRSCLKASNGMQTQESGDAQIHTFMPAAGGVGNTTLAIESAFLLHHSNSRKASTCVVDLNFQQGVCAEYLDLEPRFDLSEIENQPERLDRHLLDVMLSKHESGLCVLAAPVQPTEMRTFNTDVVVRMLDLVSAYFDNVIIDMPRTWFPWTETVLMGSNKLYIVTEMTVPCLRHTQRLIAAINTHTHKQIKPNVIVNRFEKRVLGSGVQQNDVESILGDHFVGGISNNYRLVREAVDRGVPLATIDSNANIISDLRKIILPHEEPKVSKKRPNLLEIGKNLLKKVR